MRDRPDPDAEAGEADTVPVEMAWDGTTRGAPGKTRVVHVDRDHIVLVRELHPEDR